MNPRVYYMVHPYKNNFIHSSSESVVPHRVGRISYVVSLVNPFKSGEPRMLISKSGKMQWKQHPMQNKLFHTDIKSAALAGNGRVWHYVNEYFSIVPGQQNPR